MSTQIRKEITGSGFRFNLNVIYVKGARQMTDIVRLTIKLDDYRVPQGDSSVLEGPLLNTTASRWRQIKISGGVCTISLRGLQRQKYTCWIGLKGSSEEILILESEGWKRVLWNYVGQCNIYSRKGGPQLILLKQICKLKRRGFDGRAKLMSMKKGDCASWSGPTATCAASSSSINS